MRIDQTCCVFGHRTILDSEELRTTLYRIMEDLIVEKNINTFLFGSKSRFNDLCLETATILKVKYPYIKRIYVRAEFLFINDDYMAYLLKSYDDTYYPEKLHGSGRAAYVERNYEMINNSKYCIVYYDESYAPTTRKSGTKIALDYAAKKGRKMIIFPQ